MLEYVTLIQCVPITFLFSPPGIAHGKIFTEILQQLFVPPFSLLLQIHVIVIAHTVAMFFYTMLRRERFKGQSKSNVKLILNDR